MAKKPETNSAVELAPDAEAARADWGYMVTHDGRVVRVTQRDGALFDEYGRETEEPVVEDRGAAGVRHRAA